MESGGNLGQAPPDAPDEVQFGEEQQHRRPRPLLPGLLLAALVATAIGLLLAHFAPHGRTPRPAVAVTLTGSPILGVTSGWELFARGQDSLVTIALAKGKVTRTEVPALQSGNPDVSFVVGPHLAMVRSDDFVPGYEVADGRPARPLSGTMASGGPLVQGPAPGEAWQMASGSNTSSLVLVTLSGRRVGPTITLRSPDALPATITSDGRGDVLLLNNLSQWYDAGPGWYRRVHGDVIAVGAGRWLLVSCPRGRNCRNIVLDPADGTQHAVPGAPLRSATYFWPPAGVISPDGGTAAVVESGATPSVHLLNLASGTDTPLALPASGQPADESMTWSPDGKWLFVAQQGTLVAVNAQTDRITSLGIPLPDVLQVAIRPAGR